MGPKGTGKTKNLIEQIKKAVTEEHGNVVCLEKDKKLTYDLPYTIRLVNACDYDIDSYVALRGFLSGMYAANYDITHIFIDNFFKIVNGEPSAEAADFLDWLKRFSETNNVKFTISATADTALAGERLRSYF